MPECLGRRTAVVSAGEHTCRLSISTPSFKIEFRVISRAHTNAVAVFGIAAQLLCLLAWPQLSVTASCLSSRPSPLLSNLQLQQRLAKHQQWPKHTN